MFHASPKPQNLMEAPNFGAQHNPRKLFQVLDLSEQLGSNKVPTLRHDSDMNLEPFCESSHALFGEQAKHGSELTVVIDC